MSSSFDLAAVMREHAGREFALHERYVNPAFAAAMRTIGFDVNYVKGQGAYLWDDRGNRYIDCLGGYAVYAGGRNHPVIRDAIRQAMEADLPGLLGVGIFKLSGILAKQLVELVPGGPSRGGLGGPEMVFFANGGAEAVDVAIKQARIATGRERLVYCARAYHGLTMGSLSVNGNHEFRTGFGKLLDSTEVAFNDLAALERELSRGDVAAFVVEPIQGKGVNLPAADYLREASRLCAKHGALLVLDEIQTGLGRTGKMFACEHYGAGETWTPDILVLAKALSGGYVPVSAVVSKRWVHAKVYPSMSDCSKIQTTFGQNDLAMVAGLASLHVLREERIVENAARVGERLMAGLRGMVGRHQMVKEVRGRGLMVAVEFGRPESMGLRLGWDVLHKVDKSLFCQAVLMPLFSDYRVLAQVAGHAMDVIKLIPPLVMSEQDADEVVAAFEATVGACHQFPGPAWEVGKKLSAAAVKRFVPAGAGGA
jgi:ornithine--oxo-acid transaminase